MANKKKDFDVKATNRGVRVKVGKSRAKTIKYTSTVFIAIAVFVLAVVLYSPNIGKGLLLSYIRLIRQKKPTEIWQYISLMLVKAIA